MNGNDLAYLRLRHDLERSAQLRSDLADSIGRLVTELAALATVDASSAGRWGSELAKWDQVRSQALALVDEVAELAIRGQLPAVPSEVRQSIQIHGISQIGGDLIIQTIAGSQIAAGKEINQDV
jgi:hypothetical protein